MSKGRNFLFTFLLAVGAIAAANPEPRVVSVLYFENTARNNEFAWLSKGLADMLTSDLAALPDFVVVEREQLEKILKEQERLLSDLFDERGAVRIGKLVSARQMIIGAFIIHADTLRVDAKVVDIESGKVLKGFRVEGLLEKLFLLQKALTEDCLRQFGVSAAGPGRAGTESLEAAKAFYIGVDFLDRGAFDAAAASFKEAIKIDPYYLKPQKSLEEAYKFLKDFKKQRMQRELNQLFEEAVRIKNRLAAPAWQSYEDFLKDAYKKGLSQEEIKKLTDADPSILKCNTRAQCVWELQHVLLEIAGQAEENFGDAETAKRMYREIIHLTDQARLSLKGDPFLPEILYMEIFSWRYFEDWQKVMGVCEYLMEHFPDYRMMWAIEDFYENALEKLGR